MKTFNKITWSPFATNVLDADDYDLQTKDGRAVKISRNMRGNFIINIDGEEELQTASNATASNFLNTQEVGGYKKL